MARTTRIIKIDRRGPKCTIVAYKGGGEKGNIEILGGMPEFREWIRESRIGDNHKGLVVLALKQWLAKNPGSTDFSAIEGKQVTLDLDALPITGIFTVL